MSAPTWTPQPGKALVLRTCRKESGGRLIAACKFEWPSEPGAVAEAPDWSPTPCCGNGLHGLLWGAGDPGYLARSTAGDVEVAYMVVEVDEADVVWVGADKVKFPRCTIVYVGDLPTAAQLISEHAPQTVDQRAQVAALSAFPHVSYVVDPDAINEPCGECGNEYRECGHVPDEDRHEVPLGPVSNIISSEILPAVVEAHRAASRIPMNELTPQQWADLDPDLPSTDEPIHTIAIDVDVPAHYVPSSTPGHGHLYIDVPLPWSKYERLLEALAEAGVIEPGYVAASKRRKATHLRLPWVKKPQPAETSAVTS